MAAIFFLPIAAAIPLPPIVVGMYLMLCSVTVQGSFSPVSDDGPGSQLVECLDREREAKWYLCKQSSLQSKFIQPTIVSFPATEPGNECQTMNKRKTFNFQKNSMYMGSIKSKLYPNVLTILASLAKESGVVTLSTLQCTV